ncbi:hypothetical protein PG988_016162 [Apiospora saccharicola]
MATKRKSSPSGDEEGAIPRKHPNVYNAPAYRYADSANRASSPNLSHADYAIAWICALSLELAASRMLFDEEHESLPAHDGDHNAYVLGRIAKHNVVMVALPGVYGKVNAASVSTHLKRTFPNIKATLMVGIGGGAPGEADLYLGDVVVGTRVMEYDLGKAVHDGEFERTATPKFPSSLLLSAVTNLRSKHGMDQWSSRSMELMRTALHRYSRPTQPDRLFQTSYPHPFGAETCENCDNRRLQPRLRRLTEDFWVHYGVIASGDSVNKDARKRDEISRSLQAKCFEMEAAGIMDNLECLPIRGICDYSDSHKNKAWQDYAAATAAAYARELLETIPTQTPGRIQSFVQDVVATSSVPSPSSAHIDKRQYFLDLLDFPQINARKDAIRAQQGKTCRWFLSHPKYLDWINLNRHGASCSFLLWLRGKAGAGKSTLIKFLYLEVKKKQPDATVVSFFFHARGDYLEKSITGMYRSLLKQILPQLPDLRSILDQVESSLTSDALYKNLNALKDILKSTVMALGTQCLICFIDALDECNEDDVRDMVQFFEDLTDSATEEKIQLRVCFSSRPYPYIQVDEKILLTLENEMGHSKDLEKYVRKRLKASPKVQPDLQRQILDKASGVFMWVVLVVDILNKEAGRGGLALRRRLSEIPPTLSQLFKDILTRDQERPEELRCCILWVLCSFRPLTPGEFCHAMWTDGLKDGRVDEELPDAEDNEVSIALATSSSKGLVEVTNAAKKGSTVQFIHESVRDFLIKERGLQELWPDLGFEWEGPIHESLRICCESYLMHPTVQAVIKPVPPTNVGADENDSNHIADGCPANGDSMDRSRTPNNEEASANMPAFLEYASQFILSHANKAAPSVPQGEFMSGFFSLLGTETLDCCQPIKARRYGSTATPIYVLADQGLANLIRTRLDVETLQSVECDSALPFQHPLFAAMAKGHKDAVASLLGLPSVIVEGEDLMEGIQRRSDMKRFKDRTPMSWAAQEGKLGLVKLLAQKGGSLVQKDPGLRTPIRRAILGGHERVVRFILENEVKIDVNCDLIFDALVHRHCGLALALMQDLVDWNCAKRQLTTWLYHAARNGSLDIVTLLVTKGADIESCSILGLTALIVASREGREAVVRFLISRGANLNARCTRQKMTAFEYARDLGHNSVARLLQAAADNNSRGQGKASNV